MTGKHKPLRGRRPGARLLLLLLTALLLPVRTAASAETAGQRVTVDPVGRAEGFSAVLYDNTNGLPTSEANDIAHTSEGFIWIGSYSGLIRYDGNTFERMNSSTGIASVVSLHVDSRDRLWIGTNDSGLALMEHGEYRMWGVEDGLGSAKICDIEESDDGTIYVGTTAGITMITPELELRHLDDPKIADVYVDMMRRGEDGLVYCLTNEDDFFTLRHGALVSYTSHDKTRISGITSILPDPEAPGRIYCGTETSNFYHIDLSQGAGIMDSVDISPLFSVIDIQLFDGRFWLCGNNGIGVLDEAGFHALQELPMNNSVGHMMQDYEGNLWFTSARQGVMKLVSNQFEDVFERCGVSPRVVNSTCMYNGRLFVATDIGLLVLDEDEQVSSVPLTSAKTASGRDLGATDLCGYLDGRRIRSVIRDSRNRLWISTWRSLGLLRYDNGELTAFTEADGLLSDHLRAVCETPDGDILVVCSGGVNVIRGDSVVAGYGRSDGITNPESLTVSYAPNGDIILGSNGGGIYVIGESGTRCVGTEAGLSSGIVMRIKRDAVRDVYWIVTSNSIAYMTPDYQVHTIRDFPYSNNFDLYENSSGDMWILSSNGIYVLPAGELLANGAVKPVHYGMANGLPCIATSNSYSELTQEGDLYIAGNTGVAKVNIDTPMEDISDLRQSVPFVEADGVMYYPGADGGFTLPSGVHRLTVYAYVYNYSLTDPQVSYMLEGFDGEAKTVARSELAPLTYTNLPGGSYRFVLELKDAMGRGSKTLSVPIVKEKALHEQVWFYFLIGLCAALLLGALMRVYILRKMHALEARHREEKERERITGELQMAGRIQESVLPRSFPAFPDRTEFDLYAVMDTARDVGGDFYDFFLIDDDHLCLVMADVSGKGIPAALVMMVSKYVLKSYASMDQSAAEVLTKTNEALCSENSTEMFVTVWLGILEISTGRLIAANAGHEYPVLKRADGPYELYKDVHGLVVGGMEGVEYRDYELQLGPGDRLFLYTDGVPEATASDNSMFGTDRMIDALNESGDCSPQELLSHVRSAVDAFVKDAEPFDDLTMLCLEYRG